MATDPKPTSEPISSPRRCKTCADPVSEHKDGRCTVKIGDYACPCRKLEPVDVEAFIKPDKN